MWLLDEKSKIPLYVQLYQQIKEEILSGSIKSGTRLPSSRKLVSDLHISRNTVESAYEQLYSEGFLRSKPRQGYYVEPPLLGTLEKRDTPEAVRMSPETETRENIFYDFQNKKLQPDAFPFDKWQKLTNRCFHDYKNGFLQYGCPFGEPSLRSEIQRYIYNYRQVNCKAKQIIIGSGTQFCLELVCRLLKTRGPGIAMEEPGYDLTRATFENNGFKVHPVDLDGLGINADLLDAAEVTAAYVTPSHQYPLGVIMPKERRLELVEWAKRNKTFIIEDDYNCCFQYDVKPLPSLQSLCGDRVIYMGSFSDMLFPAIGVSYMVLPEDMLEELCKLYCYDTTFVPFLTQKTLELFMREGFWEKHVRKTVLHQRKKRNTLVNALRNEFGNKVHLLGFQGGLHLLLQAKWGLPEEELVNRASRAGVKVQPASAFYSSPCRGGNSTVLLNYGGMLLEHIPKAVRLLRRAWLP